MTETATLTMDLRVSDITGQKNVKASAVPAHYTIADLVQRLIAKMGLDSILQSSPGVECTSAEVLVTEDSAHVYETTWSALTHFSPFVQPGGYFVVEDGCVDVEEMRADPTWPRGVLPAIDEFLASPEGEPFAVRRDLERYGMSCHVGGFLQRRPPSRGRRLFKGSSNVA
jgi:hypothetical protein